jgi:hypothetical protein
MPAGEAYSQIAHGDQMTRIPKTDSGGKSQSGGKANSKVSVASMAPDRLRIEVIDPGLYTIRATDLVAGLGLAELEVRELLVSHGLRLTSQGKEVAYIAAADGSALYFYAQAIESPYTAVNVYWLKVGDGAPMGMVEATTTTTTLETPTVTLGETTTTAQTTTTTAGETMTTEQTTTTTAGETTTTASETTTTTGESTTTTGETTTTALETTTTQAPTTTTTGETTTTAGGTAETTGTDTLESEPEAAGPVTSFTDTAHAEQDTFAAATLFHDPEDDAPLASQTVTVDTPDALAGKKLTVHLHSLATAGVTNEHHVRVELNGTVLGDARWAGVAPRNPDFLVPSGLLKDGQNQVKIIALLDTGVPYSVVALDSVDVTYERALEVVEDQLAFGVANTCVAEVNGLSSTDAWVLDLADPLLPELVEPVDTGGEAGAIWIRVPVIGQHDYLVAAAAGALRPESMTGVGAPVLRAATGANYIVIVSPSMSAAGTRLAYYRSEQGLKTMVVSTVQLYDEFNHGVSSPEALKSFIGYASTRWKTKARYVVLAGEGSYDYMNHTGAGDCLVPALLVDSLGGLVISDVLLADNKGGDGVPEVAIGRIPAATAAELDQALAKIKAYESTKGAPQKSVLLAADNADDGGDFGPDSDSLAAEIPKQVEVDKAYLDSTDFASVRAKLLHWPRGSGPVGARGSDEQGGCS